MSSLPARVVRRSRVVQPNTFSNAFQTVRLTNSTLLPGGVNRIHSNGYHNFGMFTDTFSPLYPFTRKIMNEYKPWNSKLRRINDVFERKEFEEKTRIVANQFKRYDYDERVDMLENRYGPWAAGYGEWSTVHKEAARYRDRYYEDMYGDRFYADKFGDKYYVGKLGDKYYFDKFGDKYYADKYEVKFGDKYRYKFGDIDMYEDIYRDIYGEIYEDTFRDVYGDRSPWLWDTYEDGVADRLLWKKYVMDDFFSSGFVKDYPFVKYSSMDVPFWRYEKYGRTGTPYDYLVDPFLEYRKDSRMIPYWYGREGLYDMKVPLRYYGESAYRDVTPWLFEDYMDIPLVENLTHKGAWRGRTIVGDRFLYDEERLEDRERDLYWNDVVDKYDLYRTDVTVKHPWKSWPLWVHQTKKVPSWTDYYWRTRVDIDDFKMKSFWPVRDVYFDYDFDYGFDFHDIKMKPWLMNYDSTIIPFTLPWHNYPIEKVVTKMNILELIDMIMVNPLWYKHIPKEKVMRIMDMIGMFKINPFFYRNFDVEKIIMKNKRTMLKHKKKILMNRWFNGIGTINPKWNHMMINTRNYTTFYPRWNEMRMDPSWPHTGLIPIGNYTTFYPRWNYMNYMDTDPRYHMEFFHPSSTFDDVMLTPRIMDDIDVDVIDELKINKLFHNPLWNDMVIRRNMSEKEYMPWNKYEMVSRLSKFKTSKYWKDYSFSNPMWFDFDFKTDLYRDTGIYDTPYTTFDPVADKIETLKFWPDRNFHDIALREFTQYLLFCKQKFGLTFSDIARKLKISEMQVARIFCLQVLLRREDAEELCYLFGLDEVTAKNVCRFLMLPFKGGAFKPFYTKYPSLFW